VTCEDSVHRGMKLVDFGAELNLNVCRRPAGGHPRQDRPGQGWLLAGRRACGRWEGGLERNGNTIKFQILN
jgi:hypothetical protein